jgi:hypothetical protein
MTPIGVDASALSADICIPTEAAQQSGAAGRCLWRFEAADATALTGQSLRPVPRRPCKLGAYA